MFEETTNLKKKKKPQTFFNKIGHIQKPICNGPGLNNHKTAIFDIFPYEADKIREVVDAMTCTATSTKDHKSRVFSCLLSLSHLHILFSQYCAFPDLSFSGMANYSRPHICQCLTRLASVKRNAVVTVYSHRRRTGGEFVDGVLSLAAGLIRLGLRTGDVVSIAALNRSNALFI